MQRKGTKRQATFLYSASLSLTLLSLAALAELAAALSVAEYVGNPAQLWQTQAALGRLRQAQGRPAEAAASFRDAITTIARMAAGLTDPLDVAARPRWPLDPTAEKVRGAGVKA